MALINITGTPTKGTLTNLTLDKGVLLAIQSVIDDGWFVQNSSENLNLVEVVYVSTVVGQQKVVIFDASQATPSASLFFSLRADDTFQVSKIILKDFDGGYFNVPSADIPNNLDISMLALWSYSTVPPEYTNMSFVDNDPGGGSGIYATYSAGNKFTLTANTRIDSVTVALERISNVSGSIRIDLCTYNGSNVTPIYTSSLLPANSMPLSNQVSDRYHEYNFSFSGANLSAGTYVALVRGTDQVPGTAIYIGGVTTPTQDVGTVDIYNDLSVFGEWGVGFGIYFKINGVIL